MSTENGTIGSQGEVNGDVMLTHFRKKDDDDANGEVETEETQVYIENYKDKLLIYGINDSPPIHVTIICALQVAVCASKNDAFKARLLSSTLFMSGITTFCMNIFGISLVLAGFVHALLGFTGLIGVMLRFVGPLTIVPTLTLIFIFIVGPVIKFVENNCSSRDPVSVPCQIQHARSRLDAFLGFPDNSILISIVLNWLLCGVLTYAGLLTDDKKNIGYNARTDARIQIVRDNPWLTFPYPATLISVLDSIGDYYACARVCRVPAPPKHAVNRGIMIEGLCSMLSGAVGCGHATSTYGGNIGAIGVTKVASRHVFIATGVIYILFGIFGKFSALFISIPYPVLGGAIVVMFGIFFGVTNMSSPRNIAIFGLSIFIGLAVPTWAKKHKSPVQTGHAMFDKIMSMLVGNPNLVGTIIACFLDNTVPGTAEERGIAAWQVSEEDERADVDRTEFNEGYEVYDPLIPRSIMYSKLMKYIPFLPYKRGNVEKELGNVKTS
ncbi:S23A2-like protein [Mya arenaria]|uniref:S23A2-like protein n=1 Tax=Mya arenaria TaxID=6604 RepID=A0ABY7DFD8_MYAAR|nr:S23A2-like protein [Mya arenaria]